MVVQGAKLWQGVWGTKSPRSWSTFSNLYMEFSCHVTADVTKNAGLLERNTNEIVKILHTLWKSFKQSYLLKSALLIAAMMEVTRCDSYARVSGCLQ